MTINRITARELPQFVRDLLASPPRRGGGLNNWLYRVARVLHPYRTRAEIVAILEATTAGEPVQPGEIERAVERSAGAAWKPGQPAQRMRPPTEWPKVNDEQRATIVAMGRGLVDLWEASPVKFDDNKPHTEEIIDALFPGDPLLCVGRSNSDFATRSREEWRGELSKASLIVPSPMIARTGRTQEGKESAHSLENTGPRRFLVIEFDPPKWGDLSEQEQEPYQSEAHYYETKRDAQAAILLHLAESAPLALAVHSGSKSVHGWFVAAGETEDRMRRFMRHAVGLGGDRAGWVRSQFERMPDGTRDNGNRQGVYFFAPEVLP
jgi:hypothetical protein